MQMVHLHERSVPLSITITPTSDKAQEFTSQPSWLEHYDWRAVK